MSSEKAAWHKLRELLYRYRRTLVLGMILYFLHDVADVFWEMSAVTSSGRHDGVSAELMLTRKLGVLSDLFGCGNIMAVLAALLGLILAVQSFSYLHTRRETELYEVQSGGNRRQFLGRIGEGVLIFFLISLPMKLLGMLVALWLQAMSPGLLLTALYQEWRDFTLFFGIYGLTTLAMTLCGDTFMALLLTGFLLTAELVFRLLQNRLRALFGLTGYIQEGDEYFRVLSSPLYYFNVGLNKFWEIREVHDRFGYVMTPERVLQYVQVSLGWDLCTLLLTLICLLSAYLAYRKRPEAAAGSMVLFRPVRLLLKLAVAFLGALAAGCFVYAKLGSHRSMTELLLTLAAMALTAIFLGNRMDVICSTKQRNAREWILCVLPALLVFAWYAIV